MLPSLKYCPGTLSEGYSTYSPTCRKRVFNNRKVSHILPYLPSQLSEEDAEKFLENRQRISISGVQEKLSLKLKKNKLRLTERGEQGQYILKPIPGDLKKVDQVPANEQLTMQIARQVYNLNTAENALIFFKNGEPAYITKRFDIKSDGHKFSQEDFSSLSGKTKDNTGDDFKYEGSYEEVTLVLKKYVPAYIVEVEKLFTLILFNYLFCNGDAHLKNFSLLESSSGDSILSPAYDLINTKLHVNDSYFALKEGLFSKDYQTKSFENNGFYAYDDFYEFAMKIGVLETRALKILEFFRENHEMTHTLLERSFLNDATKKEYVNCHLDRLKALNYSYSKRI